MDRSSQNVNPLRQVRWAIDHGCTTHREIGEALAGLESHLDQETRAVLLDEISSLARRYTFHHAPGFAGRMVLAVRHVLWKAACMVVIVAGSAAGAEVQAAKAFAGTLLDGKLTGVGDHFLYWIGRKTITVSGPEMMNATYQLATATPSIVVGMAVGALSGWAIFTVAASLSGWLWSGWRKNRAARVLVTKYALAPAPAQGKPPMPEPARTAGRPGPGHPGTTAEERRGPS
ncbi:MAG: hypothetical protein HY815_21640 [Candidatus Riflebacteria bacterium]|nr:hypothetical protein [Candidatus Riflebacteria bacterium]